MGFAQQLARLRRSRGWSQETLALRAGLSQRHISFLETGRAQPGQKSMRKLIEAMALKSWEQSSLLRASSGAMHSHQSRMDDRSTILGILDRLTIWPSYAFAPDGALVAQNAQMEALLKRAAPDQNLWEITAPKTGPNIYDLVMHPQGLLRWMLNPEEVIPETIRRLRIDAAMDPKLEQAVARIGRYDSVARYTTLDTVTAPVLVERYQVAGVGLSIISVLSHLASPGEPELDALRIESFVPASDADEDVLRALLAA